jgi:hypothetical protein
VGALCGWSGELLRGRMEVSAPRTAAPHRQSAVEGVTGGGRVRPIVGATRYEWAAFLVGGYPTRSVPATLGGDGFCAVFQLKKVVADCLHVLVGKCLTLVGGGVTLQGNRRLLCWINGSEIAAITRSERC